MKQKREEEIKLYINKYVKMVLAGVLCTTAFSACASHQNDKNYYDRANKASEKALDKLDRE